MGCTEGRGARGAEWREGMDERPNECWGKFGYVEWRGRGRWYRLPSRVDARRMELGECGVVFRGGQAGWSGG